MCNDIDKSKIKSIFWLDDLVLDDEGNILNFKKIPIDLSNPSEHPIEFTITRPGLNES